MTPQLIIAATIAAVGFGSGWQVQSWRYGAKEKANAEQKLVEVRQSAAASIRRLDNVLVAQNAGAARAIRLRGDLDSARTELDRLRNAIARTMPGASDTTGTCAVPADPARQLLLACATELVEMGGAADRHASDAMTLQQAWPK